MHGLYSTTAQHLLAIWVQHDMMMSIFPLEAVILWYSPYSVPSGRDEWTLSPLPLALIFPSLAWRLCPAADPS